MRTQRLKTSDSRMIYNEYGFQLLLMVNKTCKYYAGPEGLSSWTYNGWIERKIYKRV